MSTRERWVVYPILFLTLGIALRDKLVPPDLQSMSIEAVQIRCQELEVESLRCQGISVLRDKGGRPCLQLGSTPSGSGQIEVLGQGSRPVLIAGAKADGRTGFVEVTDAQGRPQARLNADPDW